MGKSAAIHQKCQNQRNSSHTKYWNASMLMTAPSHLVRERTCNTEWNLSTTILRDLDWKCTLDAAHWSRRPNVFFPPPQFFQGLEQTNTAATTIQRAFRGTHHAHSGHIAMEETPQDQQALSPTIATTYCPPRASPLDAESLSHRPTKTMPTPMAL